MPGWALHDPTQRRADLQIEPGAIRYGTAEVLEHMEAGAQAGENFGGLVKREPDAYRQRTRAEPIADAQHDGLEQRADVRDLQFRHAVAHKSELGGDVAIHVAGLARRQQRLVARKDCRDPNFLLAIVAMHEARPGGGVIKCRIHLAGPKMYFELLG